MLTVKAVLLFLLLLIPRLCIPISFLLSLVFAPIDSLLDLPNWPRRLRNMWDDPL